jgi:hypothetical protein
MPNRIFGTHSVAAAEGTCPTSAMPSLKAKDKTIEASGSIPTEAVACLYIALNMKV